MQKSELQMEKIRNFLRKRRIQMGKTQLEVAQVIRLSQSAYSRIETGQRALQVKELLELLQFYGFEMINAIWIQGLE